MEAEYFELPEELVQHIQSFLNPKEAARTSVLSKLWYSAWSLHPILCVDDCNFPMTRETIEFLNSGMANILGFNEHVLPRPETGFTKFQNFAWTSIERYQELNLKLNTLKLRLLQFRDVQRDKTTRLADDLISRALTLGVNDLCVDIIGYTLPDKVFSSMYLKKLRIDAGEINLPQSNGKSKVLCSRLVSLELFFVNVSDDTMMDILLGCPLMEDLRVDNCYGLNKINLSAVRCNLKTFHSTRYAALLVEWDENCCAPESRVVKQYHNLISLVLKKVKLDNLFCKLFSHRFPRLERLELEECIGPVTNIDIASNSLRYLGLIRIGGLRVIKVQVPNIQNFRFESTGLRDEDIPSLSFLTASKEWKSDFKFNQQMSESREDNVSWLSKISDSLRELSCSSKISIVLDLDRDGLGSIYAGYIPSSPTSPFVENLEIRSYRLHSMSWCYGFLFGWLLCCRPKYITWSFGETSYETIELVYNELNKNENRIVTYTLPCIHGLEEVDMEYYDEALRQWCRVQQGAKDAAHGKVKFRLRLKWTL